MVENPEVAKSYEKLLVESFPSKKKNKERKSPPPSWTDMHVSDLVAEMASDLGGYFAHYYASHYVVASWYIHGGGIILGGVSHLMMIDGWEQSLLLAKEEIYYLADLAAESLLLHEADPDLASRMEKAARHIVA